MKIKIIYISILIAVASCGEDFLDYPSTTQPTVDNYYNTEEQVIGATGLLYNRSWRNWFDKAFTSVGDVLAGTVTGVKGNSQYNSFYNFNVSSTDGLINDTWRSCYRAAGEASVLIQTFEFKKDQIGDQPFLNTGIAEARFIRGFAYFYIARTFGDVPIVPSPLELTKPGKNLVPRYHQEDVLRFAIEDLQFAETNLPEVSLQPGRVNAYSAKGMMAKVYLYMKDYENARIKAKEVIDYAEATGRIGLYPDYMEMFTSSSVAIGNIESLFALQWTTDAGWNGGNRFMTYAAPQPLVGPAPTNSGAGYSAVVPSLDMLDPATGYAPGDRRREWSVMQHGFHRADWVNESYPSGFTYDTTQATNNVYIKTGTRSNILKYMVGPNRSGEPVNTDAHSSMPTFILRYSDVLLIYAEAIMAGASSTSDASAIEAFNAVHTRAGLDPIEGTLTYEELLHERKVEFAFEGDYWFDIQRQGRERANEIVSAQERGTYNSDGSLSSEKVSFPASFNLFLPIPQNETVTNPLLLQDPVSYYAE